METNQIKVLENAIDIYGIDNQIEMVIEECSELILALQKLKRAKYSIYRGNIPIGRSITDIQCYGDVCQEIADVKIMIAQCEIIFNKETINISVDRKITRLEERLKNHQINKITI